MADVESAVAILRREFPGAVVGVDDHRPYARTETGLYGILFGSPHVGDQIWERGPQAIVRFRAGRIDNRNYEVVRYLVEEERTTTDIMYVVLSKTAHGKPVYRVTTDPEAVREDWGLRTSLPRRVLGPYLVGVGGYATAEEAVASDPEFEGDLDDPQTWVLNT